MNEIRKEGKGWQGIIKESKFHMGYGENISKLEFWCRFPKALFRFMLYEIQFALRGIFGK